MFFFKETLKKYGLAEESLFSLKRTWLNGLVCQVTSKQTTGPLEQCPLHRQTQRQLVCLQCTEARLEKTKLDISAQTPYTNH